MMRLRPGYSLFEVIVVVAILAVASAVATPSLIRTLERQEAHATVRSAARILAELRVEAVASAAPVRAEAIRERLEAAMPPGWSVSLSGEPAFDATGICEGGRLVITSARGRRWGFSLEPGPCRPTRELA